VNRQQKAERVLDLLDRPEESRERGMANLASLTDSELETLLADLERNINSMTELLDRWMKPSSRTRSSG
jgi:hypothetical protein